MKITEIAEEIYTELDESTHTSPTLISFYIRENIGMLNNLTFNSYSVNPTNSEITPDLGENEKVILKQLFLVYFYGRRAAAVLLGSDSDSIIRYEEAGFSVTKLNKNELAKTYLSLKKEAQLELDNLVKGYKINSLTHYNIDGIDVLDTGPYVQKDSYNRNT